MFDVDVITNRLKGAVKSMMDPAKPDDLASIIETDFEHENNKSKLDEKDPHMNHYGECRSDFEDTIEYQAVIDVMAEIEKVVRATFEKDMKCIVVLPQELMSRVSQDVIRMSSSEPCGVLGCVINVLLKEKDKSKKIATVFGNRGTTPTFEIFLTLQEDNRSWRKLHKVYLAIKGCILNSKWTAVPRILSGAYQLEKCRLYRSNESLTSSTSSASSY